MSIPYLYRAREAAAILRVSTRTLARWRRAGVLKATIIGRRAVRYTEAQIEAARRAAP